MVTCPHCQFENEDSGAFCAECGKALPDPTSSSPRVVSGEAVASTATGQALQGEQLRKQAGKSSGCLIAVSILNVIGGLIVYFLLKDNLPDMAQTILVINLVLAAIYMGLGIWARSSPLAAGIAGLALFLTTHVVAAVLDPTSIVQGLLVKIIVVVVLIKAIQAGLKYRQFQNSSDAMN